MIQKIIAALMLVICVLAIWSGFYFLVTTGLSLRLKIILFVCPALGIALTTLYLRNKVGAIFLLIPIALAYLCHLQ